MSQVYKIDLDYEDYLFSNNYLEDQGKFLKKIREFEYVFFLVNDDRNCTLKNYVNYSNEYLMHLEELGFVIPKLDKKVANAQCWWGQRSNKELEKKLNSKLFSFELAKKYGFNHPLETIVENKLDLQNHLNANQQTKKWLLKDPFGMSGIGNKLIDIESVSEIKLEAPRILSPFLERVCDLGTTFFIDNGKITKTFIVENSNSLLGQFRGGIASAVSENFKNHILKKYNFNIDLLRPLTKHIAESYINEGAKCSLQIDSFVYKENDVLKIFPLVEVNYRRTMGQVIQALAEKFSECKTIEWAITKNEIDNLNNNLNNNLPVQAIKLSPEHSYFQGHLILHRE